MYIEEATRAVKGLIPVDGQIRQSQGRRFQVPSPGWERVRVKGLSIQSRTSAVAIHPAPCRSKQPSVYRSSIVDGDQKKEGTHYETCSCSRYRHLLRSCDEFEKRTWEQIEEGVTASTPGFKVVHKLLANRRFD